MAKKSLAYDRGTIRIHTTGEPEVFAQEFTDLSNVSTERQEAIPGKGGYCCRISAACFAMLERNGFATHFKSVAPDRRLLVRRTKILPLNIVCINAASANVSARLGVPEGQVLPAMVIEFHMVTAGDLRARASEQPLTEIFKEVTEGDVKLAQTRAHEASELLSGFFSSRGLVLAECALEFGRDPAGVLRLAGGITPDNCLLWDRASHEKLDKDRFRRDLRGAEQDYAEVCRRVEGGKA